jgi:hypothetical protein
MVYLENACIGNIHDTSYKMAFYNDADIGEASIYPLSMHSGHVQSANT